MKGHGTIAMIAGAWIAMAILGAAGIVGCRQQSRTAVQQQVVVTGAHVVVRLRAPGMHCDGCVNTVETALRRVPGVDSVRAELASKNVFVGVDTLRTTRATLDSLIAVMGFASPQEQGDDR